jgi:fucose 4-O-acetylase-like acetyltransferase
MKHKVREPFFLLRAFNFLLGIVILAMILAVIFLEWNTQVFEMLIFVLAAMMNFIGATISFSESKKLRGNIYAMVCAVFLVIALILAMGYFVFI